MPRLAGKTKQQASCPCAIMLRFFGNFLLALPAACVKSAGVGAAPQPDSDVHAVG